MCLCVIPKPSDMTLSVLQLNLRYSQMDLEQYLAGLDRFHALLGKWNIIMLPSFSSSMVQAMEIL